MIAKVHFLGAAGEVTGSKYFIETLNKNILIDCGVFQGLKELRLLNWKDLPIDVSSIDVVLLTHGHLDHVGYLPRLLKQGFTGKIIGTAPTLAIAEIILRDSAKIHEEEAKKANEENYSKHNPALPLFTIEEAEDIITLFEVEQENNWVSLTDDIAYRFLYNGHIIGATFIELEIHKKRFVFSGDVGRNNDFLLNNPKKPKKADFLFLESTYGNKLHPEEDLEQVLSEIIKETIIKKGNLIIPSFAVERLQTLMYILFKLYQKKLIPSIPVFVDSPMGNNVIEVFKRYPRWHKLPTSEYNAMCKYATIIQSYRETWETIDNPKSKIIIAGSGMVTGGRVLTYLKQLIDESSTTVLLVGFQAEGTRGRQLEDGAPEIKIFGKYYPVKATIKTIESLSAHADQNELLDWINEIENKPEKVFLTHGEPTSSDALRVKIQNIKQWDVVIPRLYDIEEIVL